jgi:5-methylcytosine-specific restriction endonuclease McrA
MTLGELLAVMAEISLEKLNPAREPRQKKETQVSQSVYARKVAEGERQPHANEARAREFVSRAYIHASLRREVWKLANGKCAGCGGLYRLQIDHIQPIAKGGTNKPENLRLLCFHCNQRQADLKLGREKMERFRNARSPRRLQ